MRRTSLNRPPRAGRTADLPRWLWLWFPPLILVAHGVARAFGPEVYETTVRSEFGWVENMTFVMLVTAVVLGILLALQARHVASGRTPFAGFVLAMAAGCFYFAGEEVSWGHHWGFSPFSEEFAEQLKQQNDQSETNFHNLTGWLGTLLDQLPRMMLTLAALVGGILVPLWQRRRGALQLPFPWIWPTIVCLPAAVGAVFLTVPEKLLHQVGVQYAREWRMGETKEYFLAMFLMLFLGSLYCRVRQGAFGEVAVPAGSSWSAPTRDVAVER